MNINDTLNYIHSTKWQGSKPGLERTKALLETLRNPEKKLKFVHVAGTNGKGSTCACLASILKTAGYKTGLYISPYVSCFNERMQVNGEYISDEKLIALTEKIKPIADNMQDPPTEFEIVTALSMLFFLEMECEIVVLEVGMGGRLDSTNVIDTPELAVITLIGYDHVEYLGPTLKDIAGEKAGIIKPGGDVLIYKDRAEVQEVFKQKAEINGCNLSVTDFSRISDERYLISETIFTFEPYKNLSLGLIGTYQPKNAAVAITAAELLRKKGYGISDADIRNGIANVKWQGRFEVLSKHPVFILDGAHNPQGAEATAQSLKMYFGEKKIVFVVGVMADKDVFEMMKHFAGLAMCFIAVKPDYTRAMSVNTLASELSKFDVPVYAFDLIKPGIDKAFELAGENGVICAAGSLYFSAEIRKVVDETLKSFF